MDYSGEASTSGRNESGTSSRRRTREEFEEESGADLEEKSSTGWELVLAGQQVPGLRGRCHKGPGLPVGFAENWDGINFKLAPSLHLSHRIISGLTSDHEERVAHGEGDGENLLLPEKDYTIFARERLIMDVIERGDPEVMVDLPAFPDTVEYTCGAVRRTERVPEYTIVVTDSGMDPWGSMIRKATGAAYKRLWNVANRWRNVVAEQAAEVARLREDLAARDTIIDMLRRGSS